MRHLLPLLLLVPLVACGQTPAVSDGPGPMGPSTAADAVYVGWLQVRPEVDAGAPGAVPGIDGGQQLWFGDDLITAPYLLAELPGAGVITGGSEGWSIERCEEVLAALTAAQPPAQGVEVGDGFRDSAD